MCETSRGAQELVLALSIEMETGGITPTETPELVARDDLQVFVGEWDAEGVYVYQAFCDEIADWALAHQAFGGPKFSTSRMSWIKPSLGWILYRSGYGYKPGQNRVLKIKLPHAALATILSQCQCVDTNKATRAKHAAGSGCGGSNGRVQW